MIRSKGVGVYFVTQNPLDIPDTVSRQLGNRIQHALRAFSPLEQKAVKAAATTFRANPAFDTEKAIMELGIGEALVSTLDEKGQPSIVQRTLVRPPNSRVGPITDAERKQGHRREPGRHIRTKPADSDVRPGASAAMGRRSRGGQGRQCRREGRDEDELGGASRSDSFWTTLGKTIIRTGVPLATKVLTDALKGRGRRGGGGFTGFGALDTGGGSKSADQSKTGTSADEEYVPFKSIPDERGILGGRKRQ